ncbi:MAG: hypothetical protein RL456_2415, partial [Pseudomonadota bacterium]
ADGDLSQDITVLVNGDTSVETDEGFTLSLVNPSTGTLGTATATGTIANDDAILYRIVADSPDTEEGQSGMTPFNFTISRSAAVGTGSVSWRVVHTFTTAADIGSATSGTVFFGLGETQQSIAINVIGDLDVETSEALIVELYTPVGGLLESGMGSASRLILNDDLPAVGIVAASADRAEGAAGATTAFTFTVTRSHGAGNATVDWTLQHGASSDADFSGPLAGTVEFADGQTVKTVTVDVQGDTAVEGDETFSVVLQNPVGLVIGSGQGRADGVIRNDDTVPVITIAADQTSRAEGHGGTTAFTFTVSRTSGAGASSVNWSITHVPPTSAADFTGATSGTVNFADGQTTQVITVQVAGDTTQETDESFVVQLASPTGATLGAASSAGATILDDDTPVYSVTTAPVTEGDWGEATPQIAFTVTRSIGTGTGSVNYQVTGLTATPGADYYGSTANVISFAAGETSKTILISVVTDVEDEADETLRMTLSGPVNGRLGTATATATILDDDRPGIEGSIAQVTDIVVPAAEDDSIDNIIADTKWGGAIGAGLTLTYSFSTAASQFSSPTAQELVFTGLNDAQKTAARLAMDRLSSVCDITFVEVADTATSAGDIRWTRATDPALGATSYAYLPSVLGDGGNIWIGPSTLYDNPVVGGGAFSVFMHELGHAMGLEHPHEGSPAPEPGEDQIKYSLMSYRAYDGGPTAGATGSFLPTGYMLNDIAALQYLYGANTTTASGDSVYQWTAGTTVYECIWDTGGTDTIDASNQTLATTLNLNAGQWSTIGVGYDYDIYTSGVQLARDTLTIAHGSVIERAIGSAFADTLLGNDAANTLTGGGGADTLTGGAGADTFRFASPTEGGDRITDFTSGTDRIQVVSANFGGLPAGTAAGFFVSGTAPVAGGIGAFFLYDTDDRTLSFDSNGSAAGGTTLIATLTTGSVVASDIQIVTA